MKSPRIAWKPPRSLRLQAARAADILPTSLSKALDSRLVSLTRQELGAGRPWTAGDDVDALTYVAAVRAHAQAHHARDPLPGSWRRALAQVLLIRAQTLRAPAPEGGERASSPEGLISLESLLHVMSEELSQVMLRPPPPGTMDRFMHTLERTLLPALQGVVQQGEASNMGWGALFAAASGGTAGVPGLGPCQALFLSTLLPFRYEDMVGELVPITRNLVRYFPALAPLLVGTLGTHLRIDYRGSDDAVDLDMMDAALPVALQQLALSEGPARTALARGIVNGLTFDLDDQPLEYAAHFIRWMESCHDAGLPDAEKLLADVMRADPEGFPLLPDARHLHASRNKEELMGSDYLHQLTAHPLAPQGAAGGGPWGLLAGNPLWNPYLSSVPLDPKSASTYAFLKGLRASPPLTFMDRYHPVSALDALKARLPAVAHPPLFEATAQALQRRDGRMLRHLSSDWELLFVPRGTPAPAPRRVDAWKHPCRLLADTLAELLRDIRG